MLTATPLILVKAVASHYKTLILPVALADESVQCASSDISAKFELGETSG